jgi:hypothetical protein
MQTPVFQTSHELVHLVLGSISLAFVELRGASKGAEYSLHLLLGYMVVCLASLPLRICVGPTASNVGVHFETSPQSAAKYWLHLLLRNMVVCLAGFPIAHLCWAHCQQGRGAL